MVVRKLTLLDLVYKLCARHVLARLIVVEFLIAARIVFRSHLYAFCHMPYVINDIAGTMPR